MKAKRVYRRRKGKKGLSELNLALKLEKLMQSEDCPYCVSGKLIKWLGKYGLNKRV